MFVERISDFSFRNRSDEVERERRSWMTCLGLTVIKDVFLISQISIEHKHNCTYFLSPEGWINFVWLKKKKRLFLKSGFHLHYIGRISVDVYSMYACVCGACERERERDREISPLQIVNMTFHRIWRESFYYSSKTFARQVRYFLALWP